MPKCTMEEEHLVLASDSVFCAATEYHDVMMYYMLPLLLSYLPVDYFHHFALLVTAVTMLLSQPTDNDIRLADMLLLYFVKEMEPLYGYPYSHCSAQKFTSVALFCCYIIGISAMTINTHSLCHLATQVQDSGPLWANSMFPFENMVKELGYLYCGTRNTGHQVNNI